MALTDEEIDRIDNEIDYPVYVEGRDELIAQAKEANRLRAEVKELREKIREWEDASDVGHSSRATATASPASAATAPRTS